MRYVVVAALCITSSIAASQTNEQKNAMENLASLAVANQWCSEYAINKEGAATLAIALDLQLDKSPNKEYFQGKKTELEKLMGESGMTAYCSVAYKIFGPSGKIPGLMMKK